MLFWFVIGVILLSIWVSLRSYWLKKKREKKVETERLREGERMTRIEEKLNQVLHLLQDDMDAKKNSIN